MENASLKEFLASRGFEGEQAARALAELRRRGLTRAGEKGVAGFTQEAADKALAAAFFRVCSSPACRAKADEARAAASVAPSHCEVCGGSDNRRSVNEMLEAMSRAGRTRLLVVGGSPGTRRNLEKFCGKRCDLRFVTDERALRKKRAKASLDWSDVTAIWCSTEINHKEANLFRGPKVIRVDRRGISALALAVRNYLQPPS